MADHDTTQIHVNNRKVGIIGLTKVIEDMASTYAHRPDEEIETELIKRLSKKNYIPPKVAHNYGKAFLREFKKYLGQPFEDEGGTRPLEVKVIGVGCARCDWLRQGVIDALAELHLVADVEHVTDMRDIAGYSIIGSPALMINGTVMCAGSVPSRHDIKKWIAEHAQEQVGTSD